MTLRTDVLDGSYPKLEQKKRVLFENSERVQFPNELIQELTRKIAKLECLYGLLRACSRSRIF